MFPFILDDIYSLGQFTADDSHVFCSTSATNTSSSVLPSTCSVAPFVQHPTCLRKSRTAASPRSLQNTHTGLCQLQAWPAEEDSTVLALSIQLKGIAFPSEFTAGLPRKSSRRSANSLVGGMLQAYLPARGIPHSLKCNSSTRNTSQRRWRRRILSASRSPSGVRLAPL